MNNDLNIQDLSYLYSERERAINLLDCVVSTGDILAKKEITKNDYESLVEIFNKQHQLIMQDTSSWEKIHSLMHSNFDVKLFALLSVELLVQSDLLKSSQITKSKHKSFISSINNEIEMLIDYAQKNEKDIKNTLKFEHKYDDENKRSEIISMISAAKKTYYKLALLKMGNNLDINEDERE